MVVSRITGSPTTARRSAAVPGLMTPTTNPLSRSALAIRRLGLVVLLLQFAATWAALQVLDRTTALNVTGRG